MDYQVRENAPYPDVKMPYKSIYEVRLIMPAYGGQSSETTAVMTYIYQNYILFENYAEIGKVIKGIAITEMRHHEMLGKAIKEFGGNPIIAGNYKYWQGGFVNYATDIKMILDRNIIMEKKAIAEYREIIKLSKCDELKKVITRIIADEEVHILTFDKLRSELD